MSFCQGFVEDKMSHRPFKSVGGIRYTRRLQLVHGDICGPNHLEVASARLFSLCCVFLKKSGGFENFKKFESNAANTSGEKVPRTRTVVGSTYL